ncbi:thioredoxin-like domain-containing protein [Candidatus Riflebacteria bacterium]
MHATLFNYKNNCYYLSNEESMKASPDEFFQAIQNRDMNWIKTLLARDPSLITAKNIHNFTGLNLAAMQDDLDLAKVLLKHGPEYEDFDSSVELALNSSNNELARIIATHKPGKYQLFKGKYSRTALFFLFVLLIIALLLNWRSIVLSLGWNSWQILEDSREFMVDSKGASIRFNRMGDPAFKTEKLVLIYYGRALDDSDGKLCTQLKKIYNSPKMSNGYLEIIYYSYDENKIKMQQYMQNNKIPWPAVAYESRARSMLGKFRFTAKLPHLVLMDANRIVFKNGWQTCVDYLNDIINRESEP